MKIIRLDNFRDVVVASNINDREDGEIMVEALEKKYKGPFWKIKGPWFSLQPDDYLTREELVERERKRDEN